MRPPRRLPVALLAVLLWSAESSEAQDSGGWTLALAVEAVRFGFAAQDTTAIAGDAVSLRPSGRLGLRVAAQRHIGSWGVGATLGWASGDAEASNDAVAIRDRTADLSRYRLGMTVERTVATVGSGTLAVELSPTLDLWTVDGESRTCAGAEAGLALRLPLGRLAVEQRLVVGLSASPLETSDVGEEFEIRSLRALGFGLGIRVPL